MNQSKFDIQNSQYNFPYHYIPEFDNEGRIKLTRSLKWGLEYLCYQKHLHENVIDMEPVSVLEIGCGDGFFIGNLPDSITKKVGIDLSSEAINFAKAFHPNCVFYTKNISEINDEFEVIIAIEVIEHIPENILNSFFQDTFERMSNNSTLIISVPTTVLPLNSKHYRHYTKEILVEQLKKSGVSFKIKKIEYIYKDSFFIKIYRRLIDNKLFSLEIKPITNFFWRSVWKKHRIASKNNGHHLIAYIEKTAVFK
ncbi:MAG: methyltransferase domain-containing protein [Candidatus Thiocaldithrix dubininis]|uniref:Methyltransferase domain-containing protein n=1 Tax=Candidatus Thiocaldithrix dubininis TaxID=3080823 RepID=A0AA95HBH5_9GAMM|nr:MAG: methyltransferase domain-containing protein [Candidatus Thiocaldithrix dubininis]